uniref:SPRY-associated domain-containing protein n=1 Tax=Astyanax mexicanus TaxID=7994 RepID=A0A3B1ILF8_ASTMX
PFIHKISITNPFRKQQQNDGQLAGCNLTEDSCKTLTLALQSENSTLKELDISTNDLQDSGVELLCPGLRTFRWLSGSLITEKGCSSLASALRSNPSHLKELDLTYNHSGDSGVRLLSSRLEDPQYKLETLRCVYFCVCVKMSVNIHIYYSVGRSM